MDKIKTMICELLLDVICEFYENDSRAKTFGTDIELYHSEIHMLQCIADHPELHLAGLASTLGVTRGAVSQTAKRLEKKGMVIRVSDSEHGKKIYLKLTEKGETACCNHKNAHVKYNMLITELLSNADTEQLAFLHEFLENFENKLKEEETV